MAEAMTSSQARRTSSRVRRGGESARVSDRGAYRVERVDEGDAQGVLFGEGGGGADQVADGVVVAQQRPPDGGADHVTVDDVARVLAAGRVPLVVLNACQSGAVGKELEAAVATRLMQGSGGGGAAAVVAMAYSVYAVAAAEFMAAFYERLFAGDGVGQAVAAGRAQLRRQPLRHALADRLPGAAGVGQLRVRAFDAGPHSATPSLDPAARDQLR